jgi:hypothetical protein
MAACVNAAIGKHGSDGHAVGSTFTLADLAVFGWCLLVPALKIYDGVPETLFDEFEYIVAVRRAVGQMRPVVDYYAARKDKTSV